MGPARVYVVLTSSLSDNHCLAPRQFLNKGLAAGFCGGAILGGNKRELSYDGGFSEIMQCRGATENRRPKSGFNYKGVKHSNAAATFIGTSIQFYGQVKGLHEN